MHPSDYSALALGVAEAARQAGVSRSFLYEQMTAGRLAFVKAGKRRLVLVEDLRAWLSSLRQEVI
jgi:excisionase family DNA binding protein